MPTLIHRRVLAAQEGRNPTVICRMSSGWAVLCDSQFLRGYSILLPDPVVLELNDLNKIQRMQYLYDMTIIGDALLEVTGAYKINYEIMGNLEPALHAQIIPRYLTEPDERRKSPPLFYDREYRNSMRFDSERDKELMKELASGIQRRSTV